MITLSEPLYAIGYDGENTVIGVGEPIKDVYPRTNEDNMLEWHFQARGKGWTASQAPALTVRTDTDERIKVMAKRNHLRELVKLGVSFDEVIEKYLEAK